MSSRDSKYFVTLGLAPDASPEEIKRAYLALVKQWHPDRFAHDAAQQKQAEERMKTINVAYESLLGEAQAEIPFQRSGSAPAYDASDEASPDDRAAYARRAQPSAFAFWRGHSGLLSWLGTIALVVISLASVWFVVDSVAYQYAPPYAADFIRHEAKQQSVIARTRRAADAGETWAMVNMGWFHYTGRGMRVNFVEAAQWFARVAQSGDANAQTQLGLLHAKGEGVTQDYAAAASWFRAGAEQGQRDAQHNLALLHRGGLGVPADFAEAYQWWSLAAAGGHAKAGGLRDKLVSNMTEQQVVEGQRRLQATELRMPKRK